MGMIIFSSEISPAIILFSYSFDEISIHAVLCFYSIDHKGA